MPKSIVNDMVINIREKFSGYLKSRGEHILECKSCRFVFLSKDENSIMCGECVKLRNLTLRMCRECNKHNKKQEMSKI